MTIPSTIATARSRVAAETVRVMVVSRNAETARSLRSRLPRRYRILTSDEARHGIPGGRDACPDLILVDIGPPLAGAFGALRSLRSLHPDLPILTVAAARKRRTGELSLEAGATAFVPASISPRELAERIRAMASRGRSDERLPAGVAW